MRVIGGIHVIRTCRGLRTTWQVGILTLEYGKAYTQAEAKRLFRHALDIATGR